MWRKLGKCFLGLAVIGTVAGIIISYLSNKDCCSCNDCSDFTDEPEEEDFDLDSDLEPVVNREYVPLGSASENEKKDASAETTDDESN